MTNKIQAIEIKIDTDSEAGIIKIYRRGVNTYRRNFGANPTTYAESALDETLQKLVNSGVFKVRNGLLYDGKITFIRKDGK